MNLLKYVMVTFLMLFMVSVYAQVKNNTKTEKVQISGNCGMCKKKIESAGNLKNLAKVEWDANTNIATISYDSVKTNKTEILNRIALIGYDNESFSAPDGVYKELHGCCQYDRPKEVKTLATKEKKQ